MNRIDAGKLIGILLFSITLVLMTSVIFDYVNNSDEQIKKLESELYESNKESNKRYHTIKDLKSENQKLQNQINNSNIDEVNKIVFAVCSDDDYESEYIRVSDTSKYDSEFISIDYIAKDNLIILSGNKGEIQNLGDVKFTKDDVFEQGNEPEPWMCE